MPKYVDHDERRAELVQALWRVVERDGASAVSIRHVAAEAGHSKSAVAHYFPTRFSMLSAAVEELTGDAYKKIGALDLTDGKLETACAAVSGSVHTAPPRRRHSAKTR